MVVTLLFEVRNEVLFIIVGFADHPMSNFPCSQPLIFYRQKLCKIVLANLKNLSSVICGFRILDSGVRFRILVSVSGFRFPGFRVAPRKAIKMVKSPHYRTMTTVKSPTYARPSPPHRLNIDRCISFNSKLKFPCASQKQGLLKWQTAMKLKLGYRENDDPQSMDYPNGLPKWTTTNNNNNIISRWVAFKVLSCYTLLFLFWNHWTQTSPCSKLLWLSFGYYLQCSRLSKVWLGLGFSLTFQ